MALNANPQDVETLGRELHQLGIRHDTVRHIFQNAGLPTHADCAARGWERENAGIREYRLVMGGQPVVIYNDRHGNWYNTIDDEHPHGTFDSAVGHAYLRAINFKA